MAVFLVGGHKTSKKSKATTKVASKPTKKQPDERLKKAKVKVKEKAVKVKREMEDAGETLASLLAKATDKPTSKDISSDADLRTTYLRQFNVLNGMLETLNEQFENADGANTRAVYAANVVLSQLQQVLKELKNMRSPDERAELINTRILEPAFRELATVISDLASDMKKGFTARLKSKEAKVAIEVMTDLVRRKSRSVQTIYEDSIRAALDVANNHL